MPVVVRRRGVGLLGATMVGAAGYAAGKSAGKGAAPPPQPQAAQPQAPEAAPAPGAMTDEKIAQLKKLGELKQSGVLTEEEFEAQKAKILAS